MLDADICATSLNCEALFTGELCPSAGHRVEKCPRSQDCFVLSSDDDVLLCLQTVALYGSRIPLFHRSSNALTQTFHLLKESRQGCLGWNLI